MHVVIICRGVLPISGEGPLGGGRKEKQHSLRLSLGSDLRMALTLVISLIFVGRGSSGGVSLHGSHSCKQQSLNAKVIRKSIWTLAIAGICAIHYSGNNVSPL